MEYVYAAMLLHKAGQEITEPAVTKVLDAAHIKSDTTRVKALVAALQGVNIEKAIASASVVPVAAAAPVAAEKKVEEKKPKEEQKSDTEAAAGLGSLFG